MIGWIYFHFVFICAENDFHGYTLVFGFFYRPWKSFPSFHHPSGWKSLWHLKCCSQPRQAKLQPITRLRNWRRCSFQWICSRSAILRYVIYIIGQILNVELMQLEYHLKGKNILFNLRLKINIKIRLFNFLAELCVFFPSIYLR